jgi:uncharacterized protein YjhX (UPF0386 family)
MSAKNITVYMSAETVQKMEKEQFKDTNWSKVARDAIECYIRDKTQATIPQEIFERLKAEMDTEYSNGKQYAIEILAKKLSYRVLSNFFEEAERRAYAEENRIANEEGIDPGQMVHEYDSNAKEMLKDYFSDIPKDASSKYCDGVYSVLKETWDCLTKRTSVN